MRRFKYSYRFEAKRNTALVGLMIFAGLRKSEAVNLRVDDIALDEMSVRVLRGK